MAVSTGAALTYGLISGGIGLATGIGSSLISASSNNAAAAKNWQMFTEANQFSSHEAAIARDWQSGQNEAQRQMSWDMFHENNQFQREMQREQNEYNSPFQQAQRLQQVGINPLAITGAENASGVQFGLPSSSPLSAPLGSGVPPASSAAPAYTRLSGDNMANMLSAFGSFVEKVSKARNVEMDTQFLGETFESRANFEYSKALEMDARQQIAAIDAMFAESKNKAVIDKFIADTNNSWTMAMLNGSLKTKADFDAKVAESLDALQQIKGKIADQEYNNLLAMSPALIRNAYAQTKLYNAMTAERQAAAGHHYAEAGYLNAIAKTEDDKRQFVLAELKYAGQSAKETLVSLRGKNLKEALNIVDSAFGLDTGVGAYIKGLLVNTDVQKRSKAIGDLINTLYGNIE